jgi:hypothetical protein
MSFAKMLSVVIAACVVEQAQGANTFYVATNGNDSWSGRYATARGNGQDGPLASLPKAIERARQAASGNARTEIFLRDGVFVLNEPITLTTKDSGLTIAAYRNESPVVSGQTVITGWSRAEGSTNLWHARVDDKLKTWNFRELFVNNHRKQRARTPNEGFFRLVGSSVDGQKNKVRYNGTDVKPEWAKSGEAELVALQLWAGSRNRIVGADTNTHVVTLGGHAITDNKEENGRYFIENTRDGLDRPGEWFFDAAAGNVFYWPEVGEDLTRARVTVPHLTELLVLQGSKDSPVHNVTLHGLTFADTDWRLPTNGTCDVQAAVYIHGAVRGEFVDDCAIEQCEFARLGGYAVDLGFGCKRDKIVGNVMHDLGGGGVRLGDPDVNQSPARDNEITDNHIHHIGLIYPPAVGVLIFHGSGNHVARNHIHHTYYTSISLGWSWGYSAVPSGTNIIEFNHLHDVGQKMLSDMGGIYTLGLQPGTVLRNNLIHDVNGFAYGGWGIYPDEGSTGMTIENNVVYRCGSANFHQHYGKQNVVRNNIFAFGGEAQVMRTRAEDHISFFFTNNIVYLNSGSIFGGNWSGTNYVLDRNLYFDTRLDGASRPIHDKLSWTEWRKDGRDVHSVFADPLFVAPEQNDFGLKKDSPAWKLGFKAIDMRDVGVRKKFARKNNNETD